MKSHEAAPAANDYRFTGGEIVGGDRVSASPLLRIATILGRANILCLAGGVRFGCRATKRLIEGQLHLASRAASGADDRGQLLRAIVDETRGCLREVVDISSEEFQRLKDTLLTLQEETRATIGDHAQTKPGPKSDSEYTRHWKAKG